MSSTEHCDDESLFKLVGEDGLVTTRNEIDYRINFTRVAVH